ncbi:leucine-rich repeat protein SHOC-2-like [Gordionus sp. m RMFG-2023]|uniref:leucine-rich repeat protein SHOC-2-like n=1 Tax=Gordionus sp. m RMFG-2023 TaxID=3053472 RepID=UPI0031FD0FC4
MKTNAKYFSLTCTSIRDQKDLLDAVRILTETASYNISLQVKYSRFDNISQLALEFDKIKHAGSKDDRTINIIGLELAYIKFNSVTPEALRPLAQNLVSLVMFDSVYKPTLTGPKLDMLYEAFKTLNNLETLSLTHQEDKFDASFIENFPKLITLTLILPQLRHLKNSKGFRSLTNLKVLKFASKLSYLPKSIASLPHLEIFTYTSTLAIFQNDTLSSFGPELRRLHLSGNRFDKIPVDTFQKILILEYLILTDNHLESLPPLCSPSHSSTGEKNEDITIEGGVVHSSKAETKKNNLTQLDLSHNEFKDGSLTKETFASCTSLTHLILEDNHLSNLPGDMLDDSRNSLQELSFSENRLKQFPTSLLSKLNNLTYLGLAKNEFQNVPIFAFKNNPKLQSVYLNMNNLKEFDMKTLLPAKRSLSILDLRKNHLSSFDFQHLEYFDNLTHLDLSYNNLTSVKGLLDLELIHRQIYYIYLQGNPLVCDCDTFLLAQWFHETSGLIDFPHKLDLTTCSNPSKGLNEINILKKTMIGILTPSCEPPSPSSDTNNNPSSSSPLVTKGLVGDVKTGEQSTTKRRTSSLVIAGTLCSIATIILAALVITGRIFKKCNYANTSLLSKFIWPFKHRNGTLKCWNTGTSDRIRFVNKEGNNSTLPTSSA